MAQHAGGDHGPFLQAFLENQTVLRSYLLAATGNLHDSDDLLQEVSRVLWESFGRYDAARPFRAWALGIARFEVLKWRQRRSRRAGWLSGEALETLASVAEEIGEGTRARREQLQICLQRMGHPMREVVRLRYLEGLPLEAIAGRIGKSFAAVGMIVMRARRALRDCVDARLGRPGEARA